MSDERRAHPRIESRLPICYRGKNRFGMERRGDGFVTSISEGGLLVALASDRRRLRAQLNLALPRIDGGSFEISGVVVRSHEWGFAIEFSSVDSTQLANLRALFESLAKRAISRSRENQIPTAAKIGQTD